MTTKDQARFFSFVNKTKTCWLWTGANARGYGQFWLNGKKIKAHRMSWEITFCVPPGPYQVCHHCDNPLCVNPEHLFLGSMSDNIKDAHRKGRVKVPSERSDYVQYKTQWTHCPNGHEYTEANTYVNPRTKRRRCRTCSQKFVRDYDARQKHAKAALEEK